MNWFRSCTAANFSSSSSSSFDEGHNGWLWHFFFACFMHHSLLCFIIGSATLIPPERLKTLSLSQQQKRQRKRKARDKKLISLSYRCCCSSLHPVVLLYCWISFKFMVPFKKMAMNYWLPIGASSMGEEKNSTRERRERMRNCETSQEREKKVPSSSWMKSDFCAGNWVNHDVAEEVPRFAD